MTDRIDKGNLIPLSQQLLKILRDDLLKGNYKIGQPYYTEQEVSEKYGVSRTTVREAVSRLVYEGILSRERGKGTFIMGRRVHEDSTSLLPYSEEIEKRGMTPSSRLIELKVMPPNWKIQNVLRLNKEDKIIKLKRVRFANLDPIAIHDSYLPYRSCKDVYNMKYNWDKQSLTDVLDNLNLVIASANQRVYVDIANQVLASLLRIKVGAPLLIIERISFLSNKIPIEYAEIYNRGDIWDFEMVLRRYKNIV